MLVMFRIQDVYFLRKDSKQDRECLSEVMYIVGG